MSTTRDSRSAAGVLAGVLVLTGCGGEPGDAASPSPADTAACPLAGVIVD